ncbi:MAG: amino-acid N-acetyltransferase, partial [Pseudolabrys sp.]
AFVRWFRDSSPYINAFRGRTFVVAFGGEVLEDRQFATLVHDIALLNSLGVQLVLAHGARPQIERRLRARGAELRYVNGLRVTDDTALECVKDAAGSVRVEIEALLSMGLANSPMAGAHIRVASGNFVTAQPLGVREGIDYCHTGEVRRIDTDAVRDNLGDGAIVLLGPLGYSPTGEVFNLSAEDVACAAASHLRADKLVHFVDGDGVKDGRRRLLRELGLAEADAILGARRQLPEDITRTLASAVRACRNGVHRAHLINRHVDGALLLELFTRNGIGTLVTAHNFEDLRQARINDIAGLLELLAPLEQDGVLVRRSRELLEMEIDHFTVLGARLPGSSSGLSRRGPRRHAAGLSRAQCARHRYQAPVRAHHAHGTLVPRAGFPDRRDTRPAGQAPGDVQLSAQLQGVHQGDLSGGRPRARLHPHYGHAQRIHITPAALPQMGRQ